MIKTSRLALFAAVTIVAAGAFAGSTRPSAALDTSWLANKPFMNCLRNAHKVVATYPINQQRELHDRLTRACNRGYLSNTPNHPW
jgi:hypothetical protein